MKLIETLKTGELITHNQYSFFKFKTEEDLNNFMKVDAGMLKLYIPKVRIDQYSDLDNPLLFDDIYADVRKSLVEA